MNNREKNINISEIVPNEGQIKGLPANPRLIRDTRFESLKKSIEDAPDMLDYRKLCVYPYNGKYVILCGNMRYRACKEIGYKELPCYVLPEDTDVKRLREWVIKDNENFGQYDFDLLANEWDETELITWGVELPINNDTENPYDDYQIFSYRYPSEDGKKLLDKECKNLDAAFEYMIDFLQKTNADTVAFAQGGDFIGGVDNGNYRKKVLRKVMNTFFCDTEKPFKFVGRINEDVNTYTWRGSVGWLGLTVCDLSITQKQTQSIRGGMSNVYIDNGTYLKSIYSVMIMPSAVKIGAMGDKHIRFHHKVNWDLCVPKILNECYRK